MKCIFCYSPSSDSKSVEHIIPESLGNDKYILNKGIVCDKCNNYFSHKIEQPLLELPFFKSTRHILNIPSKKKRVPPNKSFMISPDAGVNFLKDLEGNESISIDDAASLKKISKRRKVQVFIPVFASPGHNNVHVSKFLGKLGIEDLALQAQTSNTSIEERVNQECLENLKRYVRHGNKDEFWPYHVRVLFHPEAGFQNPDTKEYFKIVSSMRFIYTDELQLFHQFMILGTEFTIDMINPATEKIVEWFSSNNNRSPVLEGAMQYIS